MRKITIEQEHWAIEMNRKGYTLKEIASVLGVSAVAITYVFKRNNVPVKYNKYPMVDKLRLPEALNDKTAKDSR